MKKKIICIIIVIIVLLAFVGFISMDWLYNTFGHLTMDEIVFHLKYPMDGANTDLVLVYLRQSVPIILISTLIVSFLLIYPIVHNIKIRKIIINTKENKKVKFINLVLAISIFLVSAIRICNITDINEYIKNQIDTSNFIEQEYVNPENVNIEFPEEKRNLIYIYLESMESTYYSKESGGLEEESLIPEIEKLAKENINFSNTDKLGGAYSLFGSTWTAGAMTAQTLGIPLKISVDLNSLSDYRDFLKGGYGIGEILEKEGYHNYLMLGSNAIFGGREKLYKQHGNYEIWDYNSAFDEGKVSKYIWWGFVDNLLFEFAKEKITNLAHENKPFNFTMLTADTHFEDGYLCPDCGNKYDEQYKNVIACSSKKVNEFVNWIKNQDFYENTTIVIVGDHLTMKNNFIDIPEGEEYDKTVVSIIINSAIDSDNTKNRKYCTMDLMPTTLGALGAKIDGDRLALGTNLFSNEQTLIEKYGLDYVEQEIMKTSKFYDNNILK